ncbi:MAG: D-lyxose/D-mannose family sugar isomerase, partial [Cyclobacteriaceae bacterium]
MKRSQINQAIREAHVYFVKYHWALPPKPRWDVTDFGLDHFDKNGLVLVNLAEEEEYCEKLMYARRDQVTPAHTHKIKKEDIVVRQGVLKVQVWRGRPERSTNQSFNLQINGMIQELSSGSILTLSAGERVTLTPGIYH